MTEVWKINEEIRAVCFQANALRNVRQKRMVVESCGRRKLNILGLNETDLNGQAAMETCYLSLHLYDNPK